MQFRFLTLAVIIALSIPAAHAGTVNYTTTNTPTCTAAQVARVDHVTQRQLGLDVKDPDGHYIGTTEADGLLYRNWEPIDTFKHSLCGVLDHYYFYNPLGDEDDRNMSIVPNNGFAGLITNAVDWGYTSLGDLHKCPSPLGPYCMEGEITPPDPYPDNNPWFPHDEGVGSQLEGKSICTYGPWVADHGHEGPPEIHPSEAIWWEVSSGPFSLTREHRVHLMQDDSHRYGLRSDFTPDMPSSIKPWSGTPRTAYVRQAFVLPQVGGASIYLHVYEGSTYKVTTSENSLLSGDATSGTQHTLAYNGEAKITVVEHQPDNNLGVVFDEIPNTLPLPPWVEPEILHDVCKRADGNLQGFVTLRTQFGKYEPISGTNLFPRNISGYQDLIIRKTYLLSDNYTKIKPSSADSPTLNTLSVKEAKLDPQSLRVQRFASRARVRGDLLVELEAGAAIAEVTVTDSTGAKRALSVDAPKGKGELVRLRGVDLATEQSLRIRFASGKTITNALPGLALTVDLVVAPQSTDAKLQDKQQLDSAWSKLVRYVGGANVARPSSFAHAGRWTATALPFFAARKEGAPSWEDSFEVAKLLNEAAVNGREGALTMDAAATELTWMSSAVTEGKSNSRQKHWVHAVDFSDVSLLRSDEVVLQISDVFGGVVKKDRRVWSHVLRDDAGALAAKLPDLIADLAAVERSAASTGHRPDSRPSDDESYSDVALSRRALEKLYKRSSRDGFVTPDELAILVKLARQVSADQAAAHDSKSPLASE